MFVLIKKAKNNVKACVILLKYDLSGYQIIIKFKIEKTYNEKPPGLMQLTIEFSTVQYKKIQTCTLKYTNGHINNEL